MNIRQANPNDIDELVKIDHHAYGEYGADHNYFQEKIDTFPEGVLVVEETGIVTGFTVIEILDANQIPNNFTDFKPNGKFNGKWMHIIAFTTNTNYRNVTADSELVNAAEKIGKDYGCVATGVPLTKDHPFDANGVFKFWEINGYKVAGEISWVVSPTEKLECFFYTKQL